MVLEPWLIEAALARLGDRRLTLAEQQLVVVATHTPSKVQWPDWWGELSHKILRMPNTTGAGILINGYAELSWRFGWQFESLQAYHAVADLL